MSTPIENSEEHSCRKTIMWKIIFLDQINCKSYWSNSEVKEMQVQTTYRLFYANCGVSEIPWDIQFEIYSHVDFEKIETHKLSGYSVEQTSVNHFAAYMPR